MIKKVLIMLAEDVALAAAITIGVWFFSVMFDLGFDFGYTFRWVLSGLIVGEVLYAIYKRF